MRETVRDRLRARGADVVGRSAELALLGTLLIDDGPAVAVVHGPGGVGKTTLLRALDSALPARRASVWLDGADIEPTPAAVLGVLGVPPEVLDEPQALAQALDDALDPGTVVVIDRFEAVAGLAPWLARTLVPALPSDARLCVAGRRPLGDEADELVRSGLLVSLALRNLSTTYSEQLLRSCGIPDDVELAELVAAAHGHPLALVVAADLWLATSGARGRRSAPGSLLHHPDPTARLLQRFVDDVEEPVQREALHLAAHARRVDRDLLRRAMDLEEQVADDLLQWLRDRPYAESHPDGLALHDLVRDTLDDDLRWRDPDAFADLHRRVRTVILERLHHADPMVARRAAADAVFLHRANPLATSLVVFDCLRSSALRNYLPADGDTVLALTEQTFGAPARATWDRYLSQQPEQVQVVVDHDGRLIGANAHLRLDDPVLREADPLARIVWRALDALRTVTADEVVLVGIGTWGMERRDEIGAAMLGNTLIALSRPDLGWCCLAQLTGPRETGELAGFIEGGDGDGGPVAAYLGFDPLVQVAVEDGRTVKVWARDFARSPYAEWLDRSLRLELDTTGEVPTATDTPVALSRADFTEHVKVALRGLRRPESIVSSPLLDSCLVRTKSATDLAGSRLATEDRRVLAVRLREVVADAVADLEDDPALAKGARAVDRTYLRASVSQEAAAEVLGMPFSTYRRHLARGIDALVDLLWTWDLHGGPPTDPAGTSGRDDVVTGGQGSGNG